METFFQDFRFALRALWKHPATTVTIVLALALGIGANTAIFSLVDAVMLQPLPYKDAGRLVAIWQTAYERGFDRMPIAVGDFYYWKEHGKLLADATLYRNTTFNITGDGEPESVDAAEATANFFDLLGLRAAAGRTFQPGEDRPGNGRIAVLSDGFWRRRYGGDRGLIGRQLTLDDEAYTVVGILPEGLRMPGIGNYDLIVPTQLADKERQIQLRFGYAAIGRLKPGAAEPQAQAEMAAMAKQIEASYPDIRGGMGAELRSLHEDVVHKVRPALLILLAAVGFVLLMACANAANLLLARAISRSREVAVRAALGAGRTRLVRQLLTESVVLSLLGGALGLLLALVLIPALVSLSPGNLPQLRDARLDPAVLLFTLGISLATGILFGLTPAIQGSRVSFGETLKEGSRGVVGGRGSQRLRSLLVVAEVALSMILLVGAGLMMRSLVLLQRVDPGFRPDHLLTLHLSLPDAKYPEDRQVLAFYGQVRDRLAALPDVTAVGGVSELPFSRSLNKQLFSVEGRSARTMGEVPASDFRQASPGYVQAMKMRLVKGRSFEPQDHAGTPLVALVNQTLARRYFQGEEAVGRKIRLGAPENLHPADGGRPPGPWMTVIGVVGDVRHTALNQSAEPEIYALQDQAPSARSSMYLVIRTKADPALASQSVRQAIWEVDRNLPISKLSTMEDLMAESISQTRFTFLLLAFFALTALALAVIGLYGVMSYLVNQRTHEIGLRMALGAQRGDVLRMVVRQGLLLSVVGLAVGLAAAFALSRFLASQLFEVGAHDPLTYAGISALLILVAFTASTLPARRATRVEPVAALRYDA
jgi:putative ABC transport system permease protein